MTKIIKDVKNHYVNIDQQLIRDESLSWKARGIFMYLWSQTDEWDFYAKEVAKTCNRWTGCPQFRTRGVGTTWLFIKKT